MEMDDGLGVDEVFLSVPSRGGWLYFRRPLAVLAAYQMGEVLPALEEVNAQIGRGRWAAGFLAYEAAPAMDSALRVRAPAPNSPFPLLWLGVYEEPAFLRQLPGQPLPEAPTEISLPGPWTPHLAEDEYEQAILTIKERIARGETYQVNYTYRLRAAYTGPAWPVFAALAAWQPPPYAAFLQTVDFALASLSPELFLEQNGLTITSRPMKGTAPRGRTSAEDRAWAAWLRASEKNRAENVMITDMVRSDMGRVARTGSVRVPALFDIEQYPTVWQMTSTVQAETSAPLSEILRALFPAASITGAPKVRTTQIIAALENAPRQAYCGAIGYCGPNRQAQFNVAIRTLAFDRRAGQVEYGVGGGIVWDSDPREEWEETHAKARVLREAPQPFRLIETLRWTPEESWFLLESHLARLAASAEYFCFCLDLDDLRRQLVELAAGFTGHPMRARLELAHDGAVTLQAEPLGEKPLPRRIGLARTPVSSTDRFLYHKTTRREVYRRALAECPGCDEALLWNERGEITEATIANVAVLLEGRLVTPPVECGLLAGTYRQWLLESGQAVEGVVKAADLGRCAQIWLMNSVRGLWSVEIRRV